MRNEFNLFVAKEEAAMETQTSARQATKLQLELLTKHLNRDTPGTTPTYAAKSANSGPANEPGRKLRPEGPRGTGLPRPRPDQGPTPPPEPTKSTLRRKGTDDRRMIDHHLEGLTLIHFSREMEGSIGETRNKINSQIGMSHIVKSINFMGDYDKNVTEVCVPDKFERWFCAQIAKVEREERVLGDRYMECNPFVTQWDDMELIPLEVRRQRHPRHIKKILDQWYSCAKRSQSEAIRKFYTQVLIRTGEFGRHLWKEFVKDITIDESMTKFPKVTPLGKEDYNSVKQGANKRRADEQNGPAVNTPIS